MTKPIITNLRVLEEKKKSFRLGGAEKLQILSDFDRTLTVAYVNGKKSNTSFARIREGNVLPQEYVNKAQTLFEKYYPIEQDHSIAKEKKVREMVKWFREHLQLMVDYGLTREILKKIALEQIVPRGGFDKLINYTFKKKIPFLILSSGIGDMIKIFLESKGLDNKVRLVSNFFEWDSCGKAIKVKTPIINSYNKDESEIKKTPYFECVKNRKNILLLGDTVGDIDMAIGFDFENIIKIGFLNKDTVNQLDELKKHFDVIVPDDGTLEFVTDLLEELFLEE
ncbi:MAG: hypothetical protein WC652_04810 [archaeon]|jgi:5'-nucleotidase